MSKESVVLISHKDGYDTLCGNAAAVEQIQNRDRFSAIAQSLGHTITWHETGGLHGVVQPPFRSRSDIEKLFSDYGVVPVIAGQDTITGRNEQTVTLFLPQALAQTSFIQNVSLESM